MNDLQNVALENHDYDGLSENSTDLERFDAVFKLMQQHQTGINLEYDKLFISENKQRLFLSKLDSTGLVEKGAYPQSVQLSPQGLKEMDKHGSYINYLESLKPCSEDVTENSANSITKIMPELKDKVLLFLCNNCPPEKLVNFNNLKISNFLEIDINTLSAIMTQFGRIGLLDDLNITSKVTYLTLRVDAHDRLNRFGFFAIEEIFKAELAKLGTELDNLKNENPSLKQLENINKISGIASALFAGLSLLKAN